MQVSIEKAINILGDRVYDQTKNDRQSQRQRRNQVTDLYGVEYQRQGDSQTPARFGISVSPDLVYYNRFEFKLVFSPFAMSVGNNGATANSTITINGTSLSINAAGNAITPNPHTHTNNAHNHALAAGISLTSSNVGDVRVYLEGIDITTYLAAQYGGAWIDGEGIYPNDGLDNYDILKVAGQMPDWRQRVLLQSGYKDITITADVPFNVSLVNYLKYSAVNR